MDRDQHVQRVADRNKAEDDAKHFEPRVLYDVFSFDGATETVFANPDIFRNGERYPIRITHITAQVLHVADDEQLPLGGDERMVQRYGLRIRGHGTYYQNAVHAPLPLWHNVPNAASDVATLGQSTWVLDKSFIMGNRDTFQVQVRLAVAAAVSERVSVAFHGRGLYSKEPKTLVGTLVITAAMGTTVQTITAESYRNDGSEPLEVTQVVFHHAPNVNTANPTGNARNFRVRIKCNGNGTNAWWIAGSPTLNNDLVPVPLLGTCTGRSIVHRLPGGGWLWYPNEGVRPEMLSYTSTRTESVVLAFIGYVMVL